MSKRKLRGKVEGEPPLKISSGTLRSSSSTTTKLDKDCHIQTEKERLEAVNEGQLDWRLWGPYLSERQWATVREDTSDDGNCWESLLHEESHTRAYRWGEDGLFGISDFEAQLCLSLALWNGEDEILKERLFGLTGPQGNHGEDVKECYYYLDSTPTHSYTKALYKYPQAAFPYQQLKQQGAIRTNQDAEFELIDTGVFEQERYWDVYAEYAKRSSRDLLCCYTVHNRGPEKACIHILPTLWFRNTWSWEESGYAKPSLRQDKDCRILCNHSKLGEYAFSFWPGKGGEKAQVIFTDNETRVDSQVHKTLQRATGNSSKYIMPTQSKTSYYKDAFHKYIVNGEKSAVRDDHTGTKCAVVYRCEVEAGAHATIYCRLYHTHESSATCPDKVYQHVFNTRRKQTDDFYKTILPRGLSEEQNNVARQAYAGLCFSKQFFYFDVNRWLKLKPHRTRNTDWRHMRNMDVVSMPDKWEFPWYATWDLAFHMIPFSKIDPHFAKNQLLLLLSERYMHPSGQLPAYEFDFSDVNPPVHAWACLKVYRSTDERDVNFLKRCFQKLLLNFNWWVNQKTRNDRHVYVGGFLGLDNISCIDRSHPPKGTVIQQADGTCWMAFYSACMLDMALELAQTDPVYEDLAITYLQHFTLITDAVNGTPERPGLWDKEDEFYYDHLEDQDGVSHVLRVRSLVGLSALFPAFLLDHSRYENLVEFQKSLSSLQEANPHLANMIQAGRERHLLSVMNDSQLRRLLQYLLDENEFLSPYGIRSLSKIHAKKPFSLQLGEELYSVTYAPGESNTDLFGGNSNWRGPVWLCMNYLIIESLEIYDRFYGDSLTVALLTGTGNRVRLGEVANQLSRRLISLFMPDTNGHRPCHGGVKRYAKDRNWKDLVLFYEYFHADTGRGCGASHQTGWTALVTSLLDKVMS